MLQASNLGCLGTTAHDGGAFADVVVNGDIHQQNAIVWAAQETNWKS